MTRKLAMSTMKPQPMPIPGLRKASCLRASTSETPPRAQMATQIPETGAHLGNVVPQLLQDRS